MPTVSARQGLPRALSRARVGSAWWLAVVPLGFMALFFVYPSGALILRGLTDSALQTQAVSWPRIGQVLATTLGLAAAGTLASLALGLPAAWALYRVQWRGQAAARALASVPFVLPTVVVGTAFNAVIRELGTGTRKDTLTLSIVAALAFFNVSVVIRVVGARWQSLDQGPLLAARTLGAGPARAALHVTLPALRSALVAASAAIFLFCTTSFGVVLVIGGGRISTVETEIWFQANQFLNIGAAATLSLVQVLVVSVAMLTASRLTASARPDGPKKLATVSTRRARLADLPLIALALTPAAVLITGPLTMLTVRSLTVRGRDGFAGYGFDNYVGVIHRTSSSVFTMSVPEAALNSLQAAAQAGSAAVVMSLALGIVIARKPRAWWLTPFVLLPLGVSSVAVGLGTLITLRRPLPGGFDVSSPSILIPAAQAIVAIPLVTVAILPAIRAINPRMRWAAATLGASPWRVWWGVEWPQVRRAFGQATGLAFAVCLGEFGATSFLARPDHQTLPTIIFRLLGRPGAENVGMAMATAVVLAVLTAGAMLVLESPPRRNGVKR